MKKIENIFIVIIALAVLSLTGNIYQGCNGSKLQSRVIALENSNNAKDSTIKAQTLTIRGQCIRIDADSQRIQRDRVDGLQIQQVTAEYVQKVETVLNDLKK